MVDLKELAKTALDNTELLQLIYSDLAQPGIRQVGKALETVLGLGNTLLLPVRMLNERAGEVFRHNMEKYRAHLDNIAENEIQEVAPEIGVPILERFTYVSDEVLSEMFVALLAKASTTNKADEAHPAFVAIIDNLCPDEALLIKALSTLGVNRYGEFAFHWTNPTYVKPGYENMIRDKSPLLLDPHILEKATLQYPEYVAAYIENLKRLGLIETGTFLPIDSSDELSVRIKDHYKDKPTESHFYQPTNTSNINIEVIWIFGEIRYTWFGRFFRYSCFPDT